MFSKLGVIAVLALIALVEQSTAQSGCVAQPVNNLMVTSNQILSWSNAPDEECEITEFFVNIWAPDGPEEFFLSTIYHTVDLGTFLRACEDYVFVVQPVSEHTLGRPRRLSQQLPLGRDANLAIDYFNVTGNLTTDETHLQWGFNGNKYINCSLEYRVTIEELGQPILEDIYTTNTSINLHFLAPCSTYQFGVRAINIGLPTVEGPLSLAFFHIPGHIQGPPHIDLVEQAAHHINLTYRFESKIRSPCQISAFFIDGGDSFQKTIELEDDAFRRPPVNVTITALQPNKMYFFRAYVRNEAGWSKPNVAAVQTLEED